MTPPGHNPRFFGILSRYLVVEFLRVAVLCLLAFVVVYLVVDFFDRFDDFLKHGASVGSMVRYFLFKIPLIFTQVLPVAVLASMLLALGTLSRNNEVTAMRACGVSEFQVATPLLLVCVGLSLLTLLWNEAVVPHFTRQVRYINTVEIKGREIPALLGDREIWTHGEDTFYNIESFDARDNTILGLSIYRIDKEFHLMGVVRIPQATWAEKRWRFAGGVEERFGSDGGIETQDLPAGWLELRERPSDLVAAQREAEEFNFFELRQLVENFRRKGLDPTEYVVDLHLKLAVPFLCAVMALLAIPLGLRGTARSSSLASNIATGLVIGFSYWVVLALTVSLGHSGAIPPVIAAWTANLVFAGIGVFLMLGVV
ncbi:MAG: LPS export ABC transporter permease LptG [Candidatus Binatia bacterium]